MPVTMKVLRDNIKSVTESMELLVDTAVYAGVPADKAGREETEGQPINNATLMYIHEHGAPEVNIPARPVLVPAMETIKKQVVGMLKKAASLAIEGDKSSVKKQYMAIGLLAQNAMRKRITDGPFVPLKPGTIAARRAKGRRGTKPLIDTGQLRRSLTYVIREGKKDA